MENAEEILERVDIMVYPRPGVDITEIIKRYPTMCLLQDVPLHDVSSTQVRQLTDAGMDVSDLLPDAVAKVFVNQSIDDDMARP